MNVNLVVASVTQIKSGLRISIGFFYLLFFDLILFNSSCKIYMSNLEESNSRGKGYIWNPATCSCENGKDVRSIMMIQ